MHPPLPQGRIYGKDGKRALGKAVFNQEVGDLFVVPALTAGVPDMKRRSGCTKQLDEIRKLRVAAGIAAAADGDPVEVTGLGLEGGEGFLCDDPQVLEAGIFLTDSLGAVVASFLEWHAGPGAERFGGLHAFEVAVPAEPPGVYACPSSYIHRQVSHLLVQDLAPLCV